MTAVRRVGVPGLIGAALAASILLGQGGAAAQPAKHHPPKPAKLPHHIGPVKTAWFDLTRATDAAPGLPQPGVKPRDLVVDGITVTTGQLPVAVPVKVPDLKQVAALTALTYRIPKGATVSTLSLKLTGLTTAKVDGSLPGGVAPVACPATSPFKKGSQQVRSAAPTYDCKKRTAIGALSHDKSAIQFPSIGRLSHGRMLSFVVLPGTIGLERLVFARPDETSLRLLSFDSPSSIGPAPAPSDTPTPTESLPSSAGAPATTTVPGTSGSLPPVKAQSVPDGGSSGSIPQVAGTSAPTPAARVAAVKPLDDARARAAAIALLVGLVAAVGWLSGTDRTPRPAGMEWGVGRFKSTRSGPPPTI